MNSKWMRVHIREVVIGVLFLSNILVWTTLWQRNPDDTLRVYFLDVGQGDAIFIDTPNHGRVLIDGGRNRKVISELGKILPFSDRRLDVVIATHPDADHIGGLPEVIARYDVEIFVEPEVMAKNEIDEELEKRLGRKNVNKIIAKRGQVINFNDGVRLTILFPDREVRDWDTNDASIVARLDYGESSFLFTGDASIKVENTMIYHSANLLDVDVLKAGHHGSRTSTSLTFAEITSPEYTVISAGRDNAYGHPHQEVLNILEKVNSRILGTSDSGTIKFETDGVMLKVN